QPQQTAAYDRGFSRPRRVVDDRVAVIDGAEHEHPLLPLAVLILQTLERRHEGAAARGQHEHVVALLPASLAKDPTATPFDAANPHARMQRHTVLAVPL